MTVEAPFSVDAVELAGSLDRDGFARLDGIIDSAACTMLASLFDRNDETFRSSVVMARHGYGQGEYRYFARPLPPIVQMLRETLYPPLACVAETWSERLGARRSWPATHPELEAQCAAAGQTRPTPLLLRYEAGDFNRFHQDVYGELVFPLQLVVLLDEPGRDFGGGELCLVEGRARMQSQVTVVPLKQGDAVVFPVRERPVTSARGWRRATVRHGVAKIHSGLRRTLGIIFHDAC